MFSCKKFVIENFLKYRKTPLFVPGVGFFSNVNIYVLDQLKEETKAHLKSPISPLLSPILH
jgi:hypothetical protein